MSSPDVIDDHIEKLWQISVFLENRPGVLTAAVGCLADEGINLRALCIAETTRFGILRIIADDTDLALETLEAAGFTARKGQVLGIEVPDRPGGLAELLRVFDGTNVSVEYMYADFPGHQGHSLIVMKTDPLDVALTALAQAGIY